MTGLASTKPLMSWLQLLRLPTVFTAMADILCGFFIGAAAADPANPNWLALPCLLLSSAGLYLGGMVWNDVFDAQLDALERPERPIPSGQISIRSAAVVGGLLVTIGLAAAIGAWLTADRLGHTVYVAAAIAIAVLLYDAVLKTTWAGPFSMAACRFLNLVLGASTAVTASGIALSWQQPALGAAAGLAVYIVGVTWFARNEAGNSSAFGLTVGLAIAVIGIVISGVSSLAVQVDQTVRLIAVGQFVVILVTTIVRGGLAVRNGQPPILQRTVGKMLLWIIVLDAVVVFGVTGDVVQEAAILLLVVPAMMLRQRIPMS